MSFNLGASFEIVGIVSRKPYISPTGKFAAVSLAVPSFKGEQKIDVTTFDRGIIDEFTELGVGQTVKITGKIDAEKLSNKDKSEVKKDGYPAWAPALRALWMQVEGSSVTPPGAPKPAKAPPKKLDEDDDLPF